MIVDNSFGRWVSFRLRNTLLKSVGLVVAIVAGRMYTEQQVVYSFLYSLRGFLESLWP